MRSPFDPGEVLRVFNEDTMTSVAIFVRMTETHWAKPGALLMYPLEEIEADLGERQKMKRYRLG